MLKTKMRVAGIQLGPYSNDYQEHLQRIVMHFEKAVENKPDIVCFSELMNSPYFCRRYDDNYFNFAETINGVTIKTFVELSNKYNTFVIATFFEKKDRKYYNSAAFISPHSGVSGVFRKIHIPKTIDTDETYYFSSGKEFPVFMLGEVKIGILICFDRSFPESFRILCLKGAQIIFIPVASFGFRIKTFLHELKIRAIENSIFIVAVNKAGDEFLTNDVEKTQHFGNTCVIDPFGEIVGKLGDKPYQILLSEIELEKIDKAKAQIDWFKFRRPELYKIISQKTNC